MKYLNRNKVYERAEPSKSAQKIYIFCEGEVREVDYFNFFKGLSSNIDIIAVPSEKGQSDPQKLQERAKNLLIEEKNNKLLKELHDEVWFVIDTDRWNKDGKIEKLRTFAAEKNSEYKSKTWFVAQSNPAFEIWLYYHFYSEKPDNEEVVNCKSLKIFLNDKIKGGFNSSSMPVYIQSASLNAKNNYEDENGQPKQFSTEVFRLAEVIISFTKESLDSILKNKKAATKF
jgi:hypothetical protein